MCKTTNLLAFVLFLLTSLSLLGQEAAPKWDVNNPPGEWGWEDVKFSVDEGTWMNLDVSPDGRTIVFDLLGDIYSMPIDGGAAKPLRTGLAWECQPRFSPDGSQILFTSDAGGGDNCWTMAADGSSAQQVTQESFRLLNNGVWSPEGDFIIARKHFTSQRSLGAGEMWLYHRSGGSGVQLTTRRNDQQDVNEPCISPDGRYVYYSEDMYPGGFFQYNKDPNSQIYVIKRYDRQEGKTEEVAGGPGGACRPQISHNGQWLAYVSRVRTQSVLMVKNLQTGETFPLWNGLSKDQQEAWAIFGAYPGFAWTPDDQAIVIWAQGKIWRVPADPRLKALPRPIPFTVEVNTRLAETLRLRNDAFTEQVNINVIRHAVTSPDGRTLVFSAVGRLWKMDLPDGKPQRLTSATHFEFEPAFSPDGRRLAYVSWDDLAMGAIQLLDLASGRTTTVTSAPAIYRQPSWSPNGQTLVYQKEGGNDHQGFVHCQEPGIYTIPVSGGNPTLVTPKGEYPVFNTDGSRIFFQTGGFLFGSLTKSFMSVKLDGSDEKKHFDGKYAQRFSISPDNRWVAWSELFKVYVAPLPQVGQSVGLSADTKAVPVAQVARDAGINLHWSADSKTLHWTLGNEYFTDQLTERFKFLEGAADSLPPLDTVGLRIPLSLPYDRPTGTVAFTHARLITMEGDQVIEDGTLVVEGNVIRQLGAFQDVVIPAQAKVIDCTGKTIMPGLVDVHAHVGDFRYGLSPQQNWYYYANLAYGVTTAHDPSSNSEMIFSHSEMIKTGQIVGPRLYSTGTIIYGADGDFKAVVNSLDDARSALRRTRAYGAFSIKSYNQPRREQRQQVMLAARELGMLVVPEGGSFFFHNMSMLADGHTGIEHNIPVAPLHQDVVNFWSNTRAHNTPTLIVNYGGLNGEYYWYQHTNVWEKERLLAFTPRPIIDARARYRTMAPEEEYQNGHILTSQSLNRLQQAGVNINLGAHGQLQGLGAHWELWMLQQGGMSNHQALRCATLNGALYLGMDHQIGSLKTGKLADLIVLDANPLENIRHSEQVRYTMVNGRLYDAATMHETGNHNRPRRAFYFEQPGSGNAWPLLGETGTWMPTQCACQH